MFSSSEFPDDRPEDTVPQEDTIKPQPGETRLPDEGPQFHGLGLGPTIPFEDKSNAPPVDEEKLRKLERNELPEDERVAVLRLTATYESWWHACRRIIKEEEARYKRE